MITATVFPAEGAPFTMDFDLITNPLVIFESVPILSTTDPDGSIFQGSYWNQIVIEPTNGSLGPLIDAAPFVLTWTTDQGTYEINNVYVVDTSRAAEADGKTRLSYRSSVLSRMATF